jgi:hypothetical protein
MQVVQVTQSCGRKAISMIEPHDNQTARPQDKISTFPLFNTCYPQNLARNIARFFMEYVGSSEIPN